MNVKEVHAAYVELRSLEEKQEGLEQEIDEKRHALMEQFNKLRAIHPKVRFLVVDSETALDLCNREPVEYR